MNYKTILMGFLIITLTGCVTTQLSDAESKPIEQDRLLSYKNPPAGDYGVVVVKRDSGMLGAGCNFGFYIGGDLVAKMGTSEIARFYLPVGEHNVGVGPGGAGLCANIALTEQSVIIRKDETKRFRISSDLNRGVMLAPSSR